VLSEQPFSSTKYIAAQLHVSRAVVKRTLVKVLGMKKYSLRWVPHDLSEHQKAQRVIDSQSLLEALMEDAENNFVNIVTGDESWYYWSYAHTSQWSPSRDNVPTRTQQKIDSKKSMFTLIFSGHGLLALVDLPKGQKLNSQYFCDVVLTRTQQAIKAITKKRTIDEIQIHLDNCKVHNSLMTTQKLQELRVTRLPHPPYSPDISPCDFWFFGWSKEQMRGHSFTGPDQVRKFLLDLWQNLDKNTIISVYNQWIERLQQVIGMNGEYYSE
jgi:histone-lysine N-methyltransferase SETMAR